ncbi:MAG: CoA transferase [Gracilibacteraceae bacterium]|jgi:formyl-CoA transferase|nr:CoA transferase [Gracilibacteraceae bacterium]
MKKALGGIRVLEWSMLQQGPAAGIILADLGAEVIKIETPNTGDNARVLKLTAVAGDEISDGNTIYFDALNRNKKAITLNLKSKAGQQLLYKLVEKADVFLTNYRPGIPEKMNADYETLKKYNPKLIFAHASGLGSYGKEAGKATVDLTGVARSGFMNAIGFEGDPPGYIAFGVGDQIGAIFTAFGIVTALAARERYGIGQKVDINLVASLLNLNIFNMMNYAWTKRNPPRFNLKASTQPNNNYYQCKDGKWIMVGQYMPTGVKDFFRIVGTHPEIANNDKYNTQAGVKEDGPYLTSLMQETFLERNRAEWLEFFENKNFAVDIVATYEDVFNDPQLKANDAFLEYIYAPTGQKVLYPNLPFHLSEMPAKIEKCSPRLGEDNDEVYASLCKLSAERIAELKAEGVI